MTARKKSSSQNSLFATPAQAPLAEQLRPKTLDEVIGQEHLTGPEGVLSRMVAAQQLQSVILWGPPGCGKTTIARLLADAAGYALSQVSAVASGVADLKAHFETARARAATGQRTALFVDEVHRFNRAQQDVLLPVVEDGTVVLIGATTENPSFELNSALLSRARVLVLNRLSAEALEKMLMRAEAQIPSPIGRRLGGGLPQSAESESAPLPTLLPMGGGLLPLTAEARTALIAMADGDGRYLLSMVEAIQNAGIPESRMLNPESLSQLLQQRPPVYDKAQESHYNLISALHKSMRGSDVDAALYWFARMLAGGEDPLYIARRLVRFASEDIGMADPQALVQALAARQTYEVLGSPEGELAIAQSVIYLATAPKSNAQYRAFGAAKRAAKTHGSLMPPKHILNAPTRLMDELGYGAGYQYDHDAQDGFSGQNYFPDEMERQQFYSPVERGFERDIAKRLEYWGKLRAKREG
ncbi:MAG: replication-associated recombination protein A [Rickettsiales bacterium]